MRWCRLFLISLLLALPVRAADLAEAEAAFQAGDQARALALYEEVLRASGAVDYDDLLLLPVRLLESDEDARRTAWKRWHYILIDEYQDTNAVQLELARMLGDGESATARRHAQELLAAGSSSEPAAAAASRRPRSR